MTSLATAFVTIRPDSTGFGARLSKSVSTDADKAGKTAGLKFSSSMKSALKIGGALAGAFAVTKGVSFFKDAIDEANEARKVSAQTAAVLKSTGNVAGISAEGIGKLAGAISNKTAIDDEAIQSGANLLLTFKNVQNQAGAGNDIFNQATGIMTDLSAAMGTDMKGAAIQVGKALNDPIKGIAALSRVGVSFTEQQKAQITALVKGGDANAAVAMGLISDTKEYNDILKQHKGDGVAAYKEITASMTVAQRKQFDFLSEGGHQMQAQKMVLRELNSEFRGSAEAQATPAEKAAVAWGNFKEMLGTAVLPIIDKVANVITNNVLPAMTSFVQGIQNGTGAGGRFRDAVTLVKDAIVGISGFIIDNRKAFAALAVTIGTVVAITRVHAAVMAVQAAGGMLQYLKATKLVTSATKVYAAMQWVLNAALTANPIGIVVMALAALGVGLVIAYKKSDTFRKIVKGAWEGIQKAVSVAWNRVIKPIFNVYATFYTKTLPNAVKKFAGAMTDAWAGVKKIVRTSAVFIINKALDMAEKILGAFSHLPGKLGKPFREALAKVKDFRKDVNGEMDAISDETVRISLTTIRSATAKNATTLGDRTSRGGAGPIPGAMRAMGGVGILPKVSGNLSGARSAANATAQTRHEIAMQAAEQIQDGLEAAHKKAMAAASVGALGKAGPGGRVLPAGSYRIGMPYHGYPGHNGADYPAAIGTPVYSPFAGRVTASYDLPGSNPYNSTPYRSYGRVVKLAFDNGMSMLFAHLSSRIGRTGRVAAGTMVGRVGTNGNSTGPHLHAEVNGGSVNPASTGLFDRGGILKHGGAAINLSRRPERILDPRTTRNFERLTYAMDKATSSSSGVGGPMRFVLDAGGGVTLTGHIDNRIQGRQAHAATVGRQRR